MVTPMISVDFTLRKCEGNCGGVVEQKEDLCNDVERVRCYVSG